MPKKNHLTALRLDANSVALLNDLASDLNSNKSQIMRKAIKILKELIEIEKEYGEIKLVTSKGEKVIILLG
jgi:predicted transcriptional regulator